MSAGSALGRTQMVADPDDLVGKSDAIRVRLPFIDERIRTLKRQRPSLENSQVLTDYYAPVDRLLGHAE